MQPHSLTAQYGHHHTPSHNPHFRKMSRQLQRLQIHAARALMSPAARSTLLGGGSTVALAGITRFSADQDPNGLPQEQRVKTFRDFGHPARPVTDLFMVVNVICFALQWLTKEGLTVWGMKVNALISAGQLWRLFTPMFLHGNLMHLAFNMHALNTLGPEVEVLSGSPRTALILVGSGIAGLVASYLACPLPSVGASGAIFGLGAALAVFYARHKELLGPLGEQGLKSLGITLAMNMMYSVFNRRIDNWGHFGGALGGAAFAFLLGPKLIKGPGGSLRDQPPVPLLAYSGPRGEQRKTMQAGYHPGAAAFKPK